MGPWLFPYMVDIKYSLTTCQLLGSTRKHLPCFLASHIPKPLLAQSHVMIVECYYFFSVLITCEHDREVSDCSSTFEQPFVDDGCLVIF